MGLSPTKRCLPMLRWRLVTLLVEGTLWLIFFFFGKCFYSATLSLGCESSLDFRRNVTFTSGHSKNICYVLLLEVNSPSSQAWPKSSVSIFPQISSLLSAMTLTWEKLNTLSLASPYFLTWKQEPFEEKMCSSLEVLFFEDVNCFSRFQNVKLSCRKIFGQDAKFCFSMNCCAPLRHDRGVFEEICFSLLARIWSESCP